MPHSYDVIVLGVGGMGSAALMHLAQRGLRVLGLDRFPPGHDRGSSHGQNRIFRQAYFEHPDYVPLLQRAHQRWRELEAATGSSLYKECGLFLAGPPEGQAVAGARQAARLHSLRLDDVPLDEARQRFSQFEFADGHEIVFEHEAGWLSVEASVRAHAMQAQRSGAEHRVEAVIDWVAKRDRIEVQTNSERYTAGKLVVTAGAWAARLLDDLRLPLTVLRKVQFWHRTRAPAWEGTPAFFFEQPQGCFYGFPARPESDSPEILTLKLAEHTGGEPVDDPLNVERSLKPHDPEATDAFVARTLRDVDPHPLRHSVCLYTMTPDDHFVIDRHRADPKVIFAAGFCGHGYKFAPVVGEALADLVISGQTSLPIGFLNGDRAALRTAGH